ncbi:4-amino-4-deoxychorismate lyase [Paenibacillus shirakamiensis]|uniref:4-amino-4-deoxychorismate lyase n=1 Tax=Paenibacillus shirakamiensis TaxID=1265935 RepID=A0ABS4JLZ8_9BACL|nr:aminotransferase class IV [Paenibacillus shirakamiensis]MBP2002729.1 4-amino-4-deoxychorismate lyase [Paenibacillus shirakamiensis]
MSSIGLNGKVVRSEKATISVMDHGFLYGVGLFETFRTYGGVPSLLRRHLDRMRSACISLGIVYEPDEDQLRHYIQDLLRANQLEDGYIRYTLTAGIDDLGLPSGDYLHPQEIIYIKPLPTMAAHFYEKGKALRLLQTRRNTPEGSVRLKSLHYMNNIIAKRELINIMLPGESPAEGLMLTESSYIAEGIVSNVFFIHEGIVHTPTIEAGILPGITRACVLELAASQGWKTEQGWYKWEQLLQADEVFITNSIQEIVPITLLIGTDGTNVTPLAGSACGPITKELIELYRKKAREQE